MMSLMVLGFVACSSEDSYGVDASMRSKQQPAPKDTAKKDSIPTNDNEWGTPVKNNLIPVGEPTATSHMWNGIQVFYNSKGDSLLRTAEMPVGYELTPASGFSYSVTNKKAQYTGSYNFSSNSTNTTYGEYEKDAEGNMLRKVTNTFSFPTTEFAKTLTVTHYEGYSIVNGRENAFKSHTISASFISLDSISGVEFVSNDSVYCDVTYRLVAAVKAIASSRNIKTYNVEATHVVRSFVRLVEKEEKMPSADVYVDKIIKVYELVASPQFTGSGNNYKISKWFKTGLVETPDSYFIFIDGRLNREVKKSEMWSSDKYNSAILHSDNKWYPCWCKSDGKGGWYYTFAFANKTEYHQDIDTNLLVASGLQNLTKDDRAEQTPFIKTSIEKKTYSGKLWVKVTGFDVNNKPVISYTVAEK